MQFVSIPGCTESSTLVTIERFMRIILSIVFVNIILSSCKSSTESRSFSLRIDSVKLKYELGLLSLEVPSRYDTFLVWKHFSDCSSCGYEKYRFQRKSYPIFLESGFYWKGEPEDSVDEITIFHQSEWLPMDSTLEITQDVHDLIVDEYGKDPRYYPVIKDTLVDLNSRKFTIIYSDHFDSVTYAYRKALIAESIVRGSNIKILFRHWSREPISDDYFEEALYVLRSMKFSIAH